MYYQTLFNFGEDCHRLEKEHISEVKTHIKSGGKKDLTSLIKVLLLCIFAFCAVPKASAQFSGGDGTIETPYIITTPAQLAQLATLVNEGNIDYNNKHYILDNDIDLSGYQSGEGWIPIGMVTNEFRGVFNGNNKVVTGLKINIENNANVGLFGRISNATIRNLGVVGVDVTASHTETLHTGAIVGYNGNGGNVINCYSTGTVNATSTDGISYTGGITGWVRNRIENSYSSVSVYSSNSNQSASAGGITGTIFGGTVTNCYSTGSVNAISTNNAANAGGIAGDMLAATLSNSAALNPSITGSGNGSSLFNRIIGKVDDGNLSNNIAFNNMLNPSGGTSWSNTTANGASGESITAETINADGSLGNRFTTTNGWTLEDGKLPGLFGETVDMPEHLNIPIFSGGDGTVGDPYIISTPAQLALFATFINEGNETYNNKNYKLANDIDLSDYQAGAGWIPIGTDPPNTFKGGGIFDGNNKKITGLVIDCDTYQNVGLFGRVDGATVKNLGVEGANINASHFYQINVGGIAGFNGSGSTIINCYSTGSITGSSETQSSYIGGITGWNRNRVESCYSTASVNSTSSVASSNAGGIAGSIMQGTVINCYVTGSITATSTSNEANAGGIAGHNLVGTVSNSAALNPSITLTGNSNSICNRIVGKNEDGNHSNNIAFENMLNPSGGTSWSNTTANGTGGESITAETINADGSLGGRFTSTNNWTTVNGKLPGLFGVTVDMPDHLSVESPPTITTLNLPEGQVGIEYYQTLTANGDIPITWSLESGYLPTGLNISAEGVISGTPSAANTFDFTVKAINNVGFDTKILSITIIEQDVPPTLDILWKKNFGGNDNDDYRHVIAVSDGVVAVGLSAPLSFNNGDWPGNLGRGNTDAIAVKYDNTGELVWKKNFGGAGIDNFLYATAVSDGFVAVGFSDPISFGNGDWLDIPGKGSYDAIIVKYDNDGNIVWKKHFGGTGMDWFNGITSVSDGYVAVGYADTFGNGDWTGFTNKGYDDAIAVKFDLTGEVVWKKNFGGTAEDYFHSITAVPGGVIAVGHSTGIVGGDWEGFTGKGGSDGIIVKFDNSGNVVWKNVFGGDLTDRFQTINTVSDGVVVVGQSLGYGNGDWECATGRGSYDGIIVKYDFDGEVVWNKNFGGNGNDNFLSVTPVSNGIVAVGRAQISSFGNGDLVGASPKGGEDCIIVHYTDAGNVVWKNNFGGNSLDLFNGVVATSDGFVAVGQSAGFGSGDWTGLTGKGGNDATIVKFSNLTFNFIPVTNLINLPTQTLVGESITLTGSIIPSNATNRTIVWSVVDAGTTGASVTCNTLSTTSAGIAVIKASIIGGTSQSVDFERIFNIAVGAQYYPVTNLEIVYDIDCKAVLTWDAPDVTEQITYKVYRNDVQVASNITATTYTDTEFDIYSGHIWAVTVVYEDSNESEPVSAELESCKNLCDPVIDFEVAYNEDCEALLTWTAPAEAMCQWKIAMYDMGTTGWNGASISITVDDVAYGSITLATGNYGEAFAMLPSGEVKFYWNKGSADWNVIFHIYNPDNQIVFSATLTMTDVSGLFHTTSYTCNSPLPYLYNVYRDSELIAEEISETSYVDTELYIYSGHIWEVITVCENVGVSSPVSVELESCREICDQIKDLEVAYNEDCEALLTWSAPVEAFCSWKFSMYDLGSDGWNGAYVGITVNGKDYGTVTMANNGTMYSEEFVLLPSGEVKFYWYPGAKDNEIYFTVTDPANVMIINTGWGGMVGVSGLFFTHSYTCEDANMEIFLYNVYRNGELIAEEIEETSYTDSGFDIYSGHLWEVTVICEAGDESIPVNVELDACSDKCLPITDLEVVYTDNCEAELTWSAPEIALCEFKVTMYAMSAAGWNGALLEIKVNGVSYSTHTLDGTNYRQDAVMLPSGDVEFYWTNGSNDGEVYFFINAPNGTQILNQMWGSMADISGLFHTYTYTCDAPLSDNYLYNVYRDGVLIAEEIEETYYTDSGFDIYEGHLWEVTVLCDLGDESIPAGVELDYCTERPIVPYITPNTALTYTFEDLVTHSAGTVIKEGAVYIVRDNVTISSTDALTVTENIMVRFFTGKYLVIEGSWTVNPTGQAIFTNYTTGEYYGTIRVEEDSYIRLNNATFTFGSGMRVIDSDFEMDNCTMNNHNNSPQASSAISSTRGKIIVKNSTFRNNVYPAFSSGTNVGCTFEITNCYLENNSTANTNRPQINVGPARSGEITKIIGNTIIGNRSLTMVGGISTSSLLSVPTTYLIEGNLIKDNRYGITFTGANITGTIKGNTFTDNNTEVNPMNGGSAINITSSAGNNHAIITENIISGSLWGITLVGNLPALTAGPTANIGNISVPEDHPDYNIGQNIFFNNGNGGVLYDLYNNNPNDVMAQNNRWGVPQQTEELIRTVITDKFNNPLYGTVTFMPPFFEDCDPVTNLSVIYNDNCEAVLTWNYSAENATFNVFRDETLVTSNITAKTYTDAGFDTYTSHIWAVTVSCFDGGESDPVDVIMEPCAYIITATAGANGSINPSGNVTVNHGADKTFAITPNEGYNISQVLVDGTDNPEAVESGTYTFTNVTDNHTIEAFFVIKTYTIEVSANPEEGGEVTGNGTFNYGTSVTVEATANEGYDFVNWTENGSVVHSLPVYTFTVLANRDLVANFIEIVEPTYTVTFVVMDEDDNEIEDATITFNGETLTGVYIFENVQVGKHQFLVTHNDFDDESGEVEVINEDVTHPVTLIKVSIRTNALSNLIIYPNPATDELRIRNYVGAKYFSSIQNIEIFDVFGRNVQSEIINPKSEIVIDISNLSDGIYFVVIESITGEKAVYKMVKK